MNNKLKIAELALNINHLPTQKIRIFFLETGGLSIKVSNF